MTGATADAVQAVIEAACKPGPRRPPKLPAELAGVPRHEVQTAVGPVAAWRLGDGPAVLLVHGWQDSTRLWSPLMVELRARGRAFVAYDLPAHGFSSGEWCMQTETVESAHAVAAALGPIDAVVAHSFAGVGLTIAISEGLPATRLVLIAPPLHAGPPRWQRIARQLGLDESVGIEALDRYRSTLPPSRAEFVMAGALPALDADVLLVASHADERFPLDLARELVDELPRGQLHELDGVNHRNSARVAEAVTRIADFV